MYFPMEGSCFDSFNHASLAHAHYLCSGLTCQTAVVSGQVRTSHRFPSDDKVRAKWLDSLHLKEEDISPHSRVCNLHFRDGNTKTIPSLSLVCSPSSYSTPCGKHAANHASLTDSAPPKRHCLTN